MSVGSACVFWISSEQKMVNIYLRRDRNINLTEVLCFLDNAIVEWGALSMWGTSVSA